MDGATPRGWPPGCSADALGRGGVAANSFNIHLSSNEDPRLLPHQLSSELALGLFSLAEGGLFRTHE